LVKFTNRNFAGAAAATAVICDVASTLKHASGQVLDGHFRAYGFYLVHFFKDFLFEL
jgi:hypothetical protein